MTVATISIDPFDGTVVAVANSVMTLPVGASSGTLSQEAEKSVTERPVSTASRSRRRGRVTSSGCVLAYVEPNDNTLMGLQGQHGERGYAMAALLVSLAVMSVLMTARCFPPGGTRLSARRKRSSCFAANSTSAPSASGR